MNTYSHIIFLFSHIFFRYHNLAHISLLYYKYIELLKNPLPLYVEQHILI